MDSATVVDGFTEEEESMSEEATSDEEQHIKQFKSVLQQHGEKEMNEMRQRDSDEESDPNWFEEEVLNIAEMKDKLKQQKSHRVKEGTTHLILTEMEWIG